MIPSLQQQLFFAHRVTLAVGVVLNLSSISNLNISSRELERERNKFLRLCTCSEMNGANSRTDLTLKDLEAKYSKAARAELNRELDRAFRLYIEVAQDFMHLGGTTTNASIRAACKTNAGKSLGRAELIKQKRPNVTPVVIDRFSEQEQFATLRSSSVINGTRFSFWSEASTSRTGSSQPALSPEQIQHSAAWSYVDKAPDGTTPDALHPYDIIQHIVSDCSVCAAIAVCIEHDRRFGSKLGYSSLQQEADQEHRYDLKVMYNGTYRRVNIDDQLPCYPDGRLMCLSTTNRSILWPSLIEKAYMKLVGGYDFPGSNSGIDLHALTGWIPEHIDLRGSYFEREATWERIARGFREGRSHCYAVIDVIDDENGRRMTIIDSRVPHEASVGAAGSLGLERLTLTENVDQRSRPCELSWDSVCNTFEGIYLSWDPAIFPQKLTFHGKWKRDPDKRGQPQHFRTTLKADTSSEVEIWVLLTRHVTDSKRKSEYVSLSVQHKTSLDVSSSYLKGSYTDSTHFLAKAHVSPTSCEISVIASYDGDYDDVGFTLTALSSIPISWVRESTVLHHTKRLTGAFTAKTAGGNPSYPSFMNNPQYRLRIPPGPMSQQRRKVHVEMTVESDRHIPVNAMIAWSKGNRITELAQNEIVASSGPYSYGFAHTAKELSAGEYTVIISAFDPQSLGPFSLDVASTQPVEFESIAHEGDGMISKVMRGSWTTETATGGPSFNKYTSNPIYELNIPTQSHLKVRLQLVDSKAAAPINVTIFRPGEDGVLGSQVATSGPYTDTMPGVITPQILAQPGKYLIVSSTYSPGILASFKLIVYSSTTGVSITNHQSRIV
ncbi:hypothetical protein QCA50_005282 [Cerrena zonata]|uniref:Calpain catalytic domain-containing protein n=1 Tax=Cerrena zonata TaxID=2478898 RepID=A0AAW0GNQ9_9APHY